ncbi:UNVERIFIED_ORG: hypothetical protein M2215_000338 [Bradyrhizobium japonicum]|jgi:hypothetical protein|uniref:DUF6894 family protein n=1 Tax=Bradyrhizobium diazoefficiens TaxID=1355477 RepID=UPI0034704069
MFAFLSDRLARHSRTGGRERIVMRTYYFDMKDGVPARDKSGLEFGSDGAAIAHSKSLAEDVRTKRPGGHPDLRIVVIDENGREVHREPVYSKNR